MNSPGTVAEKIDAVPGYPGGKSGAGIYQRLINLVPPHRVLVSAFAGKCGVTRNIKPAEHTIVIDADADVCDWWDRWRRTPDGRAVEIHHCDSIDWIRHRFGLTRWNLPASSPDSAAGDGPRILSPDSASEYFLFGDPPYVLGERSHGRQYAHEMSDDDHGRYVATVCRLDPAAVAAMVCGYRSPLYAACDRGWRTIDHRVPTRGGLQNERIWMNYAAGHQLHDLRYIGDNKRSRERIRRRQRNWSAQLAKMNANERAAMLETLNALPTEQT